LLTRGLRTMAAMLEPAPEIRMTIFSPYGDPCAHSPKKVLSRRETAHLRTVVLKPALVRHVAGNSTNGDTSHGFGIHP